MNVKLKNYFLRHFIKFMVFCSISWFLLKQIGKLHAGSWDICKTKYKSNRKIANIRGYDVGFSKPFNQELSWDQASGFGYHEPYRIKKLCDENGGFILTFKYFSKKIYDFLQMGIWALEIMHRVIKHERCKRLWCYKIEPCMQPTATSTLVPILLLCTLTVTVLYSLYQG